MRNQKIHIFTRPEAALAYVLCAERIFGNDIDFLNVNPSVVPIFVSQLFQSLEISIKYVAIESGLFTESEARSRTMRVGHGIQELAWLAVENLGFDSFAPVTTVMTYYNKHENSKEIIRRMICGKEFEKTRNCYASRCLGYAQIADGDFEYITDFLGWIAAVKETAENLEKTVDLVSQWKESGSDSRHFAIWG